MNQYFKSMKKNHLFCLLFYLFLGGLICSFLFLRYFYVELGPGLVECASDEVEKMITVVLNRAVREYMTEYQGGDILEVVRDKNEKIEMIRYNTVRLNQFTLGLTSYLEERLDAMIQGNLDDFNPEYLSKLYLNGGKPEGILFLISMGSATGNSLLANIGPKIPLRLSVVSNVFLDVSSKITNYGLNNAMVEVISQVKVSFVIQMPFLSKKVVIQKNIPLTMEILQGEIPQNYLDSFVRSK